MARRITIMLDDDVFKKLRIKQAKLLSQSEHLISFSKVLNKTLRDGLRRKG